MGEKIELLKQDIAELTALENQATRQKVKDILSIEKRKLTSELIKLQEELNNLCHPIAAAHSAASAFAATSKHYQVQLNNYGWDQTDKFVKFYVNLPKVHTVSPENVTCTFTDHSFELNVRDLDDKDYVFRLKNLLHPIKPTESNWKIKTDTVLVNCAKIDTANWSHVTEADKKAHDKKYDFKPKPDEKMDPGQSLMELMKNMYDKGDDELKRTIAKAWTESQGKGVNL